MDLSQIILVLAALGTLIWEVHSSRADRKWDQFLQLVTYYEDVASNSKEKWKKIKKVIQDNPETKHEITNRTSGIEYLSKRANQHEQLYAIEHDYIEKEIQSLNLLNFLCKHALKDEDKEVLLKSKFSKEIAYFQYAAERLTRIRNQEVSNRSFTVPKYKYLQKINVKDWHSNKIKDLR